MNRESDCCQEFYVNAAAVAEARKDLPGDDVLGCLSRMFQALGDPNRLKILLSITGRELCVCDLGEILAMSAPAVSHHLRRLKDLGLVKTRREGKLVYYSLDDEHVRDLLLTGKAHILHR